MTNWLPDLSRFSGPRYRAIAEPLAADIRDGRLTQGTRLPTHRDLAWRLHVTVGTVSRAYAEAERRSLIGGEVGRGTFVREAASARVLSFVRPEPERADFIDLSFNYPIVGDEAPALAAVLARLAGSNDLATLLQYVPSVGRLADREAGAAWIARSGLETAADRQSRARARLLHRLDLEEHGAGPARRLCPRAARLDRSARRGDARDDLYGDAADGRDRLAMDQ